MKNEKTFFYPIQTANFCGFLHFNLEVCVGWQAEARELDWIVDEHFLVFFSTFSLTRCTVEIKFQFSKCIWILNKKNIRWGKKRRKRKLIKYTRLTGHIYTCFYRNFTSTTASKICGPGRSSPPKQGLVDLFSWNNDFFGCFWIMLYFHTTCDEIKQCIKTTQEAINVWTDM